MEAGVAADRAAFNEKFDAASQALLDAMDNDLATLREPVEEIQLGWKIEGFITFFQDKISIFETK